MGNDRTVGGKIQSRSTTIQEWMTADFAPFLNWLLMRPHCDMLKEQKRNSLPSRVQPFLHTFYVIYCIYIYGKREKICLVLHVCVIVRQDPARRI